MSLFINSPAYFSQTHGIDDEIYQMCNILKKNIDIRQYTAALDTVGITPIIAPEEELKLGKYKEVKLISLSYRYADISLHIDYLDYLCANCNERKRIIIRNILDSLLFVKKRLKNEFDYERIENDILTLVNEKQPQ